ncbi:hypothetical protein WA026_000974 [Henosepilachna vigintioctopunctata]|uniref:RNA-directed DNA polymerase n=4 Tax=Henosepilachna vigintioctopunctata TaxID=420089 RepID=A0AAW1UZE4_9CUCU
MCFGLNNAPQTMQRLMDSLFPSGDNTIFAYLDDIIIASPTFESHLTALEYVFKKLKSAGLTINLEKCQFCRPSLKYLGFIIDAGGLRTDPDKVSAMLNYPTPKTTSDIKRLIGLVSWYRRFIKDFSAISAPINNLLHGKKKGQPIKWTAGAEDALSIIKERLTTAPVLASPDFSKPFVIQCDASMNAAGCVLYQECDGLEHPIAYASRSLTKTERKYSVTEKEALAVLFGIEHFRPYVEGTHFKVITDHHSLLWLKNLKDPAMRLARWSLKLSQYSFDIEHRKGVLNVVPDALSRSIDLIDVKELTPDTWYSEMVKNVRKFPSKYPDFQVQNDCLYKHVRHGFKIDSNLSEWKLVIPTANRLKILKENHDLPTSAHFGISKTLARITEHYYWPKIKQSVRKYCLNCNVCKANKSSNQARMGLMGSYKMINFPFQLISLDLMGPFPKSKQGYKYLLVVSDWFTKFIFVHPLREANAKGVMNFMENNIFLIFGTPQIVVQDNATMFVSSHYTNFLKSYKITPWFNAKRHPQANPTERSNRTVLTAICSYIHDTHVCWNENIYKIAHAINTAKHEVTGVSPAFLLFGRLLPTTGDFYGPVSGNDQNLEEVTDRLKWRDDLDNLPSLYSRTRQRLYEAYLRNKRYYDMGKRKVIFSVGDKVWKRNFPLSNAANKFSAKLCNTYVPCRVHKVMSDLVYNLVDLDNRDLGNWHVRHLKADLANYSDSDSDIEHEDNIG